MLSDVPDEDIYLRKASESQKQGMGKGFLNAHVKKSEPQNGAYV